MGRKCANCVGDGREQGEIRESSEKAGPSDGFSIAKLFCIKNFMLGEICLNKCLYKEMEKL